MALSLLRLDMRAPSFGTPAPELYDAAMEMAAWVDDRGFDLITLSEHHAAGDGYLPSPIAMAGALAGRTRRIRIQIAALLVPLHDPVKLAEDLAVLDLASGGRVAVVAGLGYRPEEYALFGRDWSRRGRLLDEALETMLRVWRGEPLEVDGRELVVGPAPRTRPHPPLFVGGQSGAAARRAARFGLPFQPASNDPEMIGLYRSECEARGVAPVVLAPGDATTVFVAEDPDRAWATLGPHLLHDARSYASWQPAHQRSAVHSDATSVEELRREGKYRVLTPEACVEHARAAGPFAPVIHFPLCGGAPPALGWRSLELYVERVLPRLREDAPA
ncbi:MAG: LLM class flavin-dependent oxidoreductase [Myxococcota bacterium]|nr:LLM class flavin-dependent oxidoreductase [Myxococcota bacterium]